MAGVKLVGYERACSSLMLGSRYYLNIQVWRQTRKGKNLDVVELVE